MCHVSTHKTSSPKLPSHIDSFNSHQLTPLQSTHFTHINPHHHHHYNHKHHYHHDNRYRHDNHYHHHHRHSPYVIGTMSQMSSSSTTNLQLHHMFRWVLYSNHIRPVSGFLGRFLCRHMIEREVLGDDGCEAEKGLSDEKISIDKVCFFFIVSLIKVLSYDENSQSS